MPRTLVFGEVLWDLLPRGAILGGAPLNFASRLNELGNPPQLVSRVGADALGSKALSTMADLKIDISPVQTDTEHETGTVRVSLVDGQPSYKIASGVAYDFIEGAPELDKMAAEAECLYFGTLAQRSPVSSLTIERLLSNADRALKFLDLNLRPGCWDRQSIVRSLTAANIVKLNDAEAEQLIGLECAPASPSLGRFAVSLSQQWDLKACIITMGSHGALGARPDGEVVYHPAFQAPIVDTVGAGDAFSAGFVHRYLRERDIAGAIRFGNALGALAAGRVGGTGWIEPWEIEAILEKGPVSPDQGAFARV